MSPLTIDDIKTVLSRKLKNKIFEVISCSKVDSGYMPIGFLSTQEKVCINYSTNGCNKQLYLFIKKIPDSEFHRNVVISGGGFRKEVILFEKFLNVLKENTIENIIPTCYLGRPDDIVILNDLTKEGFSNYPLLETFPEEHARKALESLAAIHAASIIFEKKSGCKLLDYIPILKEETLFSNDENNVGKKIVLSGLTTIRNVAKRYLPHYENELIEKVLTTVESIFERLKPSTKYQNVLCHSDLWANNIMFSYDCEGKVKEACIVDFQVASYRTPAYDLLLFLHTCTDKNLRDEKYTELLQHYYEQMKKVLKSDDIDINNIFPLIEFDAMLDESRPMLLSIAPLCLNFVLMPDHIIRDILHDDKKYTQYLENDRTDITFRAMEDCEQYKKRLLEGLSEAFDFFNCHTDL